LTFDKAGNLYGTASSIVFQLVPPSTRHGNWTEVVLHSFTAFQPIGNLAFDEAGNLYGVSNLGPDPGFNGTVFQLSPPPAPGGTWTYTVLHNFENYFNGGYPVSGLIMDTAGNLYGTTEYGGEAGNCNGLGCGTVFELIRPATPGGAWTYTVLYYFEDQQSGAFPVGGLAFDTSGNLYGATDSGGAVFQLAPPSWTFTVIYRFTGGHDGSRPDAALTFNNGILYGTTLWGGGGPCPPYGCGTAFQLAPPQSGGGTWTETILHAFQGGSDGNGPLSNLVFGVGGALYGTTSYGGGKKECPGNLIEGCGTVFKLVP
jgi:hypothetical protein